MKTSTLPIPLVDKILSETIMDVYLHPSQLELVWKPLPTISDVLVNDYAIEYMNCNSEDDERKYNLYKKTVETMNWDTIIFPQKKLIAHTKHSHQPSYMPKILSYTIENIRGITLKNLTEAVYRLKINKYSYWYELFISIQVKTTTTKTIEIEVNFDHEN